jgi:hypothetical protein
MITCIFTPNFTQVKASVATTPQKGTYIQFGYYNDVPIIWKVLDTNEKGLLLVSDKKQIVKLKH